MGARAHWKSVGVPSLSANGSNKRAERKSGCTVKHVLCSVCAATACFLTVLAVSLLNLQEPTAEQSPGHSLGGHRTVTLLIWTHPFGRIRPLPDCWQQYRVPACTLTDDVNAYDQADAVIVHHREISNYEVPLPPEPRPRSQKWIWMNHESPSHTMGLWRFEGLFNLTLSYRKDADIPLPYGYLIPRAKLTHSGFTHQLAQRPGVSQPVRLLAWVISNWSESQARVAFYRQLSRFVKIDVYGRAGIPLPAGSGNVVRLLRQYLFYLALENSLHTDYITEKLWNAVLAGAVPVVLGPSRKNYERFLPPEAFIHVEDFPTVRELARYLIRLRRSPALLRRHLNWRRGYSLHQPTFWGEHYCTACSVVRRTSGMNRQVPKLEEWFNS